MGVDSGVGQRTLWSKLLTVEDQPTGLPRRASVLSLRCGSLNAVVLVFNTSLRTWGEEASSALLRRI